MSGVVAVAAIAVVLLLVSGFWTNSRYARFQQIPAHYDIRGRATRLTSRALMAWLLPGVFSLCILAMAVMLWVVPKGMQNGDSFIGILVAAVSLLAAQAFVLRLLSRWAREQDGRRR